MILSWRDMLRGRAGGKDTLLKWLIHIVSSLVLRIFFRRIEVIGAESVPRDGAVIFVLNHPSGLIDPALVFCALPRHATFLAKATLFEVPVVKWLVRAWAVLPVNRRVDASEVVVAAAASNDETFAKCHAILRRGGAVALFPEGVSHDFPYLLPIKTGAARIAIGTAADGRTDVLIIPVGIYYTSKTQFRSEALLYFGASVQAPYVKLEADGTPPRDAVQKLNEEIYQGLYGVTLNVESQERLADVRKAERLFSSFYETVTVRESLAKQFSRLQRFAEAWSDNRSADGSEVIKPTASNNQTVSPTPTLESASVQNSSDQNHQGEQAIAATTDGQDLQRRLARYEAGLHSLRLRPAHLSLARYSSWYVFRLVVLPLALLWCVAPLAFLGIIIHFPAYILSRIAARIYATHGVDDILPTARILAATVLVPTTWLICLVLLFWFGSLRAALFGLPLIILSGYVAMKFREQLQDLSGWLRASLLFVRHRRRFLRLLLERRELREQLDASHRSDSHSIEA